MGVKNVKNGKNRSGGRLAAKIAALAVGVLILAGGAAATVLSITPRATWISAVEAYGEYAFLRTDADELDKKYNNYPVLAVGDMTYDEGGAEDPIFGVSADGVLIARISEMYQWQSTADGYEAVWSEEILSGGDGHENPSAFPSGVSSKTYTAHNVKLGGLAVTDDQLNMMTAREEVGTLPDVDVRGFYTSGAVITNAADMDHPEIGDVRIRYEYVPSRSITIAGMQRSVGTPGIGIIDWKAPNGLWFSHVFEGKLTLEETARLLRTVGEAGRTSWLLLAGGAVLSILGAGAVVAGYSALTGYEPRLKFGKGKTIGGASAAASHAAAIGVIVFAVSAAAAWSQISILWLAAAGAVAVTYAYFAVIDVFKRTPRREKVEAEYKPILIKKDEFKK